MSVRTEPRFTRDADLAVAVHDDREAETIVLHLQNAGYRRATVLEQQRVHRMPTARLTAPGQSDDGPVVDLLFASSGIEREIVEEAETLEVFAGVRLPIARTGHLIALKLLSRDDINRPQDLIDLRALVRTASPEERSRARAAVALIERRGYHRGRTLASDLENVIDL